MKRIGGNVIAKLEYRSVIKNEIGEDVDVWQHGMDMRGFLDLMSGDSKYTTYNAKTQESTHIFITDFLQLGVERVAEISRMVIDGNNYDVMLIDNPMGMGKGSHFEIYLKYTGGQGT
jgi:hypothetical protein